MNQKGRLVSRIFRFISPILANPQFPAKTFARELPAYHQSSKPRSNQITSTGKWRFRPFFVLVLKKDESSR